VIDENYI